MARFKHTEESSNWMKVSMGINITKTGLCEKAVNIWKDHMLTWPQEELEHLPEFFQHAEDGKIVFQNQSGCKCLCSCPSDFCDKLVARMDGLRANPKSRKSVWNPAAEAIPQNKTRLFQLAVPPTCQGTTNRKCNICGQNTCMFERQRKGELVFNVNSGDCYVDKYLWKVANLFMMRGKERNEIPNTGPADTECTLFFKMMKNCILFNPGMNYDEEYDEILEVLKLLKQTFDRRLTKEAVVECFERMNAILKLDLLRHANVIKAERELAKLEERVIVTTALAAGDVFFIRQAFLDRQKAVEQDFKISGHVAEIPYVLEGVLKVGKTKLKQCGNQAAGHAGAAEGATVGAVKGAFLGLPGATLARFIGAALGVFLDSALE